MKKILLFSIAFGVFYCSKLSAQQMDKRTSVYGVDKRTSSIEAGIEYLMPHGDFGKIYDNGFGGVIRYRYAVSEFKSLLASVGYNTFKGQVVLPGNNPAVDVRANFIPIKIGLKFGLSNYLYAAGEIGGTVGLGVSGVDKINPYVKDLYQIKGALFNFAPTFGVLIPAKNKNYLDLSIRYEGMSYARDVKFFTGIRAAYGFNIAR